MVVFLNHNFLLLRTPGFKPLFNEIDGRIDRKSHSGVYLVSLDGYPLNPSGRTGICGRSKLGRWGPNHAADPVVTRFVFVFCPIPSLPSLPPLSPLRPLKLSRMTFVTVGNVIPILFT